MREGVDRSSLRRGGLEDRRELAHELTRNGAEVEPDDFNAHRSALKARNLRLELGDAPQELLARRRALAARHAASRFFGTTRSFARGAASR